MGCNKDDALKAKEVAEKKLLERDIAGAKKFALKAQNLYPQLDGLSELLATLDASISAEKKEDGKNEDAFKAKEIAEKKFFEKDFAGAKKFALRAQNLNPQLDGISQLLITLEIYLSAKKKAGGEVDWYRVLGVEPQAADYTIRKQYRKLALIVHPDRNNTVGANGAFNILSEAWNLLSDNSKRIDYDCRRNWNDKREQVLAGKSSEKSSVPYKDTPYCWPSSRPMEPDSHPSRPTFWCMCSSCTMHYEFHEIYINNRLFCPNCHKSFLAIEIPKPNTHGKGLSNSWTSSIQRQNPDQHTAMKNSHVLGARTTAAGYAGRAQSPAHSSAQVAAGIHSVPSQAYSSAQVAAGVQSVPSPAYASAQAAAGVQTIPSPAYASAQVAGGAYPPFRPSTRRHEEVSIQALREQVAKYTSQILKKGGGLTPGSSSARLSTVPKRVRPQKNRCVNGPEMATQEGIGNRGVTMETIFVSQMGGIGSDTRSSNFSGNCKLNSTRELSRLEVQDMLMKRARKEIHQKIRDLRMDSGSKRLHKSKDYMQKTSPDKAKVDTDTNGPGPVSMSVPDPDFHDFDENRSERSFGSNQIWAAYDDDDGMPRYYCMVHRVISENPFKMRISWLNSRNNEELAPLDWIASGFPKTVGDFRVGKHEVTDTLNSFSHQVNSTKGTRGVIQIYPAKGQVWALYRNWSPDWNVCTPNEVIHKYDMVQVLDDYNEERGVSVVPLVKVVGFKTVFSQLSDPGKIRKIPREEMFRFSHQAPSYMLTGDEDHNAPKDCLEIDPAASPLELLQVITEAQKEERGETVEEAKEEDPGVCLKGPKVEEVKNSKTPIEKGPVGDVDKDVLDEVVSTRKDVKEPKFTVYVRKRRKVEKTH